MRTCVAFHDVKDLTPCTRLEAVSIAYVLRRQWEVAHGLIEIARRLTDLDKLESRFNRITIKLTRFPVDVLL